MVKHFFMTLLATGFVAKRLLIRMASSSVTTGLAHSKLIIWTDQNILIYLPEFRKLHELVCGFKSVCTVVFTMKTS